MLNSRYEPSLQKDSFQEEDLLLIYGIFISLFVTLYPGRGNQTCADPGRSSRVEIDNIIE